MDPSPQRVRTRRPARPRNVAFGCLVVLVVIAALGLLGRFVRSVDDEAPPTPIERVP